MNVPDPKEDEIFQAALQLPAADTRAAFLTYACEGDQSLRQRIEARILERLAAGGSLAPTEIIDPAQPRPASGGAIRYNPATELPTEKPGDVIGRYKLLEQIGEGGFGLVYVAEQREPVKRRVALKVIKLGMDTREVIARFEAERQALAMMDHSNIAKVLDAGATEQGRPYL